MFRRSFLFVFSVIRVLLVVRYLLILVLFFVGSFYSWLFLCSFDFVHFHCLFFVVWSFWLSVAFVCWDRFSVFDSFVFCCLVHELFLLGSCCCFQLFGFCFSFVCLFVASVVLSWLFDVVQFCLFQFFQFCLMFWYFHLVLMLGPFLDMFLVLTSIVAEHLAIGEPPDAEFSL